jgi:hypothetical protein
MQVLVGNDWKSTVAGYAGSVQSIAAALTTFLAVVAMQDPAHNWLWTILAAAVTCAATIVRIIIGIKMNYVQSDPNIGTLANPQVVNVTTTGPVPEVTAPGAVPVKQ